MKTEPTWMVDAIEEAVSRVQTYIAAEKKEKLLKSDHNCGGCWRALSGFVAARQAIYVGYERWRTILVTMPPSISAKKMADSIRTPSSRPLATAGRSCPFRRGK